MQTTCCIRMMNRLCILVLMTLFAMATAAMAAPPDDEATRQLTNQYLSRIESGLVTELDQRQTGIADWARTQAIDLSMWGPFSSISSWTLELLGESSLARTCLFFAMPVVRYMSAPFLFPVETDGTSEERNRDIDRIFRHIAMMEQNGMTATLDNVGDASLSQADAKSYKGYYLALIRRFATSDLPALFLSLKLSALTYDLDTALLDNAAGMTKREQIKSALVELLQAAADVPNRRVLIRVDMEEYVYKNLTLDLVRQVIDEHRDLVRDVSGNVRLGVVIQAYLHDAPADVEELIQFAKDRRIRLPLRLVKGAYEKYEKALAAKEHRPSPVFDTKAETDACYEALTAVLLDHLDAIDPAFATHNVRTMAHVMALADQWKLSDSDCAFQMLYGMGDPIKKVVVAMGYPMRVYIPAGSFARGLKYAGRRFHELANSDNALARTMRADFSAVEEKGKDSEETQ
ncbi:proline dehydrogenase family protein [Desulfovibrio inopinatus]|uniref:proline dehydrogenase family protein n=1 Tax=Desulfovibrio inopinatus TaxID=102109 RepID=UPI0004882C8F|nr:proline dehydrogenase family protein [Desulfovibrio inopinatus]